jgi:membrane protease YdiL (CAAX protease family)
MILAFPLLWAAAVAAAYVYAQDRGIPWHAAVAVLPAFLLEISLYYTLGVERLRRHIDKLPPAVVAMGVSVGAVAPYVLASIALHTFSGRSLVALAALALIASFWYVDFPHKTSVDVLFLIFIAAVWLLRVIPPLYVSPNAKLPVAILGQLMWFRTGLFAMLSVRRMPNIGFGFWPAAREWKIGALYFAGFLPIAAAAAWATAFTHPHLRYASWEKTTLVGLATFFGILWVVALGEEFFFRGLLQTWIARWLKSEWGGLALASLLFGAVHLWYRPFPNWRIVPVAACLGLFCGLAFRQARSIRASMVTHALAVTAWRLFFT